MKSAKPVRLVTVNGGSSSIKFALFAVGSKLTRIATGVLDRIGRPDSTLRVAGESGLESESGSVDTTDHEHAANKVADWLAERNDTADIVGIGHRIVHGGLRLSEHQEVTDDLMAELRGAQPFDLAHLPREIALLNVLRSRFPTVRQVACFDSAFHRDMPRVAKLLPIPRRYNAMGIRRLGFHGLSYTYLMDELQRVAGTEAANGRVVLAHLGSGASMAAVRGGRPMDTSMSFTPTAGLVMGTRPGDLDPGLVTYLMREEKLTAEQMDQFLNQRCGMLGISETSADMRDLTEHRSSDVRAAEAFDLFCYQALKCVGGFAAALGGLDTLIFSGGIGEHSPAVRARVCAGLEFLGIRIDAARNELSAAVISADDSRVTVRVIPTDEEIVIARTVQQVLGA